jgi:hypothetical protein
MIPTCQAGVGPGVSERRRKCGEPAEWLSANGRPVCDTHARYAHGPRKGLLQTGVVPVDSQFHWDAGEDGE